MEVGDTVRLKSGGPQMTITECPAYEGVPGHAIEYPDRAKCTWFDNNGEVHDGTFKLAALEPAE